ncbi:hypothetical protein AMIS_58780 [Actinoplanes missouriensis 431]|uniref:HIRAN domain-containing protein n=1 Tax=Actinoplanes missouriensis (strain ATCC 14538 / DSM 43046 / CBS 188.64 / JCM 3121 / NBRC 102363 / NCIMB 12654 / NRRL B-3342 / UNCC 431) TaxID=512565 RepID=I0HDL1_ACTM4|nr:HIRAN domain-containing protein [Actinoplanes missouriensis]BAL91098.1 hypothetical protein AMIS_58780 [Actinoplanes missouriensis 431]
MSVPFDLWGQRGWANIEVVGESHYTPAWKALFGASAPASDAEIVTPVRLMPDPRNRHDPNAVGVWASTGQIGHLSRADAARYVPVLAELVANGWDPQVTAHLWGGDWGYSARLELAEPHLLVPGNAPPTGPHLMLPLGNAIQVTGEEHHLDALIPWLCPEGECWVHATLHEVTEQLARSTRTVVEVRIDGVRVGQLTPKMSGEVLPAVRMLAEGGLGAGVRAVVKGNRLKAEVVLQVVRAHELPESWIADAHVYAVKMGAEPSTVAVPPPPVPPVSSSPVPVGSVVSAGSTSISFSLGPVPGGSPQTSTVPPVVPGPAPVVSGLVPVAAGVASAVPGPAAGWDPGTIPPEPTGIRFVVPPNWPEPPAGWKPPPGWRPDPSWPPPPYGWLWWVPSWD